MTRKIVIILAVGLFVQSCGFLFYNYRGYYDGNFSIPNDKADTNISYKVGQLIYRQSYKSDFYRRVATKSFDSLYFYGPDYHWLKFKIVDSNATTNIHFNYNGFNGWRGRPPHKLFITSFRDSLINVFSATEIVNKEFSNEKK